MHSSRVTPWFSVIALFFVASAAQAGTLTVSKTGSTGTGTVTSADGGINCDLSNTDCSESYASNAFVTLTATPNGDSVFVSWTGVQAASDCTGSANPITFKMQGAAAGSCTVNFALGFALTVTVAPRPGRRGPRCTIGPPWRRPSTSRPTAAR